MGCPFWDASCGYCNYLSTGDINLKSCERCVFALNNIIYKYAFYYKVYCTALHFYTSCKVFLYSHSFKFRAIKIVRDFPMVRFSIWFLPKLITVLLGTWKKQKSEPGLFRDRWFRSRKCQTFKIQIGFIAFFLKNCFDLY